MVITGNGPLGRRLAMQTRQGSDIDNWQEHAISPFHRNLFSGITSKYPDVCFRTQPSPIYNCHGLTFAARRTCIIEITEIHRIIEEDGYKEIPMIKTLPGDIILYFSENGDIEHSALVVSEPIEPFYIPTVVSKWGSFSEAIHPANRSPYTFQNAKCYRIEI